MYYRWSFSYCWYEIELFVNRALTCNVPKDQHSWKTHGTDLAHTEFSLKGTNLCELQTLKKKKKSCLEKTKTPRRDERPGDLMSSWTLQQCLIFQHTCTQVTVFYCSSRKWHIRQEWTAKFFKSSSFLLTWESFRVLAEKLQNFILHKTKKLNWQPVRGRGGLHPVIAGDSPARSNTECRIHSAGKWMDGHNKLESV